MSAKEHKTVLLIEDNADLRTATEDLLETLGYAVVATHDAAHGLDAARREPVDLMVVNAYPRQGRGIDAVDQIRAVVPGLPALLVSGFGDDLELRERVVRGSVGFLPMPFSAGALQAKIEETLHQGPQASAASPGAPAVALASPPTRGWTGHARPWLAVAALALAVGVAYQLRERAPEIPAPELGDVRRGGEIELLEPIGDVAALPTRLAWRGTPNSELYRVVLLTVDDTEIWQSETKATSIELPERVLERLHPAVSYFWQVEGYAEDFSRTGRSTLAAFRSGSPGGAV